jgi:hypothetical protein
MMEVEILLRNPKTGLAITREQLVDLDARIHVLSELLSPPSSTVGVQDAIEKAAPGPAPSIGSPEPSPSPKTASATLELRVAPRSSRSKKRKGSSTSWGCTECVEKFPSKQRMMEHRSKAHPGWKKKYERSTAAPSAPPSDPSPPRAAGGSGRSSPELP